MKPKQIASVAAISTVWGSLWLLRPFGMSASAQLFTSALSYLLGALLLVGITLFLRLPLPGRRETAFNLAFGITLIAAPLMLSLWASSLVAADVAFILFAATPLVTAFFCDAPWSARNAGIAGIAGFALLAADSAPQTLSQWLGACALLAGLLSTASSLAFAKKHIAGTHPIVASAMQFGVAGVVLLAAACGSPHPAIASSFADISLPLLAASVASACLAYPLLYWLLRGVRADQAAAVYWGQFILSVLESALRYRIHLQWRIAAGLLILLASLVALLRSKDENKLLTVGVTARQRGRDFQSY